MRGPLLKSSTCRRCRKEFSRFRYGPLLCPKCRPVTELSDVDDKVLQAAHEVVYRVVGPGVPYGRWDRWGRFWPDKTERAVCCQLVQNPSRYFPLTLRNHCKTIVHVATRYDVSTKEVRKTVRDIQSVMTRDARSIGTWVRVLWHETEHDENYSEEY